METLQRLPFKARMAVFEKLEKIVDIASLSKAEREMYDESIKVYRDNLVTYAGAIEEGREKGIKEGREIGKAEGERKANLEHAKTMKTLGLATDVIMQVTGLSAEEIEKL